MGLPVVVTGVHPPAGGEAFVRRAGDLESFLAAVEAAAAEGRRDGEARHRFAAAHTWERRVEQLFGILDSGGQRVAEKLALFAVAP
jgi:hypothetical protein